MQTFGLLHMHYSTAQERARRIQTELQFMPLLRRQTGSQVEAAESVAFVWMRGGIAEKGGSGAGNQQMCRRPLWL